ncbi:hypothetical protein DSY4555 [Desulfitobacterium hafniense Y51]|uniref:Uncharacterized protein n=1 Tax=Desulfitobacterium hafniense (strain Y51) TaxID=138119 RepID=Q24NP8_DESHY|nr:hypothetical protein DSY4555 [Desulfitobacterium hafniense Y51]
MTGILHRSSHNQRKKKQDLKALRFEILFLLQRNEREVPYEFQTNPDSPRPDDLAGLCIQCGCLCCTNRRCCWSHRKYLERGFRTDQDGG